MSSNKNARWRLVGIWLVYVLVTSLPWLIPGIRKTGGDQGLYSISFGFGPVIENLCKAGRYEDYFHAAGGSIRFTGHRMLLIPYGMAGLAKLCNSAMLGLFLKNALCGLLAVWGGLRVLRDCPRVPPWMFGLVAVLVVTFPKLLFFNSSIDFEEGYLIAPIFVLFTHLAGQSAARHDGPSTAISHRAWMLLAIINAAMFLTKSSMLFLTMVNSVLVLMITRQGRLFAYFGGALGVALLAWATHNHQHSGRFTISNSFDWYNVYRGNCERTLAMYPDQSLDLLDLEGFVVAPPGVTDEWSYDRHWREKTLRFAVENPAVIAGAAAKKLYVMLLDLKSSPYLPRKEGLTRMVELANIPYMAAYRALLIPMLVFSIVAVVRRTRGDVNRQIMRRLSLVFLATMAAYGFSYVAGFAYQRHAIPLVPVVLVYALHVLNARQPIKAPIPAPA